MILEPRESRHWGTLKLSGATSSFNPAQVQRGPIFPSKVNSEGGLESSSTGAKETSKERIVKARLRDESSFHVCKI